MKLRPHLTKAHTMDKFSDLSNRLAKLETQLEKIFHFASNQILGDNHTDKAKRIGQPSRISILG